MEYPLGQFKSDILHTGTLMGKQTLELLVIKKL